MSEGISYGGSLTTAEAEDSVNFEVIGYLQNYACNLAKALTDETLEATLTELKSLTSTSTLSPTHTKSQSQQHQQAQIHFLAQLLGEFITHTDPSNTHLGTSSLAHRHAKLSALESVLTSLAHQPDFCTVICASLGKSLAADVQNHELGSNPALAFTSLVQYLTAQAQQESLSNLGIITFVTAISSGWHFLDRNSFSGADSSLILDLANRILVRSLEKEILGSLTKELRESILFAFTSSEAIHDPTSPVQKIVKELSNHTNINPLPNTNNTSITNMAERLSPAASGLITNLLAELGPGCTASTSTLRDSIRQITRGGAGGSFVSSNMDEQAMARLIIFFSERGTNPKPGSSGASGSSALGTLTNDFDIRDGASWNLVNVAQVISEDYGGFNWDDVAMKCDVAEFRIRDVAHFNAFLALYKAGARRMFPVGAIAKPWENRSGQLSFLEIAFTSQPNVFDFALNEEEEKDAAVAPEDVAGLNRKGWASGAVLHLLLDLSDDASVFDRVRIFFVRGINSFPGILFCALYRVSAARHQNSKGKRFEQEVLAALVRRYFLQKDPSGTAPATIRRLMSIQEAYVIKCCVIAWRTVVNEGPAALLPALAHFVQLLNSSSAPWKDAVFSKSGDLEFSVMIAFYLANGANQNELDLRSHLESQVGKFGKPYIIALIQYIRKYHQAAGAGGGVSLMDKNGLSTALSYLRSLDNNITNERISNEQESETIGEHIATLAKACYAANPSLVNNNSDDIEEAANSYFQKIYTSEQSIDEVVEMLKRFKTSGDTRENDIFACMIHNLFDEYRFFSKYPTKELRITGILFGKLIQEQLVNSITLGIALRYVLEALRKHDSPKMFEFGMFALEQFKSRLHEWPQYCSHIVQIPDLKENYNNLVLEIEEAKNEKKTTSVESVGGTTNGSESVSPEMKDSSDDVPTTVKIIESHSPFEPIPPTPKKLEACFGPGLGRAVTDTNEDVQHEAPNSKALDRVQQLMNNVTVVNAEQTANDIKNILDAKNFGWLGQYLVVKRISTQPNYHHVYLSFLEHLGDYGKDLIEAILSSVYLNVGSLLRSPEITTSSSQRSLLKNLGSWLGQITLARNKPILQITLDCKELLYQGYETGRLFAVTPFVAKILEGAKNSKVFRPPNPWVMGLLSVFRSLYEVEDLKMNIKFEVEVLCKNLGLTLGEIQIRKEDLAKRIPPVKTSNPDFNIKNNIPNQPASTIGQNTPGAEGKTTGSVAGNSTGSLKIGAATPSGATSKDQQTVIPNLASYVTINPQLIQMFQQLGPSCSLDNTVLKRSVPIAVDRAIREIIQPVVERSVTIACITTKEIVTKDFAMESDENKMRKAAQLMVANLAGSLALVACREPLKVSVSNHLRQLLVSAATPNTQGASNTSNTRLSEPVQNAVDQCVSVVSQDNLELGCTLIEKAATEKAVRDIEESLKSDFMKRQKHRETMGNPFYDMSIFSNTDQRYPNALPEPLRPKPGGLRNDQLLVYEAFQRIPRQPTAQQPIGERPSTSGTPGGKANARFSVEVISSIAMKLENAVTALLSQVGHRAPEITLSRIPVEHEIKQLILAANQMTTSVATSGALTTLENDSALGFAQTIFRRLYELRLSEPLRLEAFVALLESLKICCRHLEKDLGTWTTYAPADTDAKRKLHRTVLLLLLRSKLLQVTELDNYLFERVNGGRNAIWLEFTIAFIRTAVHENIVNPKELLKTMSALMEIAKSGGQNNFSNQIAQLLRAVEEKKSGVNEKATVDDHATIDSFSKGTHQESSSLSAASLANLSGATARAFESTVAIAREDPPGLKERIVVLLDGWMRIINDTGSSEKMLQYVQLLQTNGIGNNEEQSERFFRVSTDILVTAVLAESKKQKTFNYSVIDGYSKLVVTMMKHLNTGGNPEEVANQRISLLNQILGVTMRSMMASYEHSKRESGNGVAKWDQRPYFRLLLNLVIDLNSPSPIFDPISNGILRVFGTAFHVVQPLVIPGFAFAWLELVSHRMFLSNLLSQKGQKGWALAHQLLIDLFLFLEPHLRKVDLSESMRQLYKGTMRVLLVLLHDYPAFLAGYHLSFCNIIPENCVQLRNLVLSAFPRGMVLPDPFTPNLKIDVIPEMSKSPLVLSNVVGPITAMRDDLDNYLKNRQPAEFIDGLIPRLYKIGSKDIDVGKVNSLVLYVGMHAIAKQQSSQISHRTAEMEVLQKLMDFDDRGRYISLNAIANQLRFPSSHTHYFSCVMLFLFGEAKDEGAREQVTRVLLERLIVHRPHPWGLLVTFIELIKNQRYQFWSHPFTHCATEIEKVFESVARSCLTPGSQKTASVGEA